MPKLVHVTAVEAFGDRGLRLSLEDGLMESSTFRLGMARSLRVDTGPL